MSASRDITDAVLASPAGTVVLGRSGQLAGSVWVVIDGDRLGRDGGDGAGRLVCVHAGRPGLSGQVRTEGQVRLLRMRSDEWRVGPTPVVSTPAALA